MWWRLAVLSHTSTLLGHPEQYTSQLGGATSHSAVWAEETILEAWQSHLEKEARSHKTEVTQVSESPPHGRQRINILGFAGNIPFLSHTLFYYCFVLFSQIFKNEKAIHSSKDMQRQAMGPSLLTSVLRSHLTDYEICVTNETNLCINLVKCRCYITA